MIAMRIVGLICRHLSHLFFQMHKFANRQNEFTHLTASEIPSNTTATKYVAMFMLSAWFLRVIQLLH